MKHTGLKKNEMVIGYNYWVNNELLGLVKIMDGLFIFHKKTGVYHKELAMAFEDEIIPLRNLLEALGYETTEEFITCQKI